jgi:ribosomal protein S27AE
MESNWKFCPHCGGASILAIPGEAMLTTHDPEEVE